MINSTKHSVQFVGFRTDLNEMDLGIPETEATGLTRKANNRAAPHIFKLPLCSP